MYHIPVYVTTKVSVIQASYVVTYPKNIRYTYDAQKVWSEWKDNRSRDSC